jgi:hypothetical protein
LSDIATGHSMSGGQETEKGEKKWDNQQLKMISHIELETSNLEKDDLI